MKVINFAQFNNTQKCMGKVYGFDYNDDGSINFRELTALAYYLGQFEVSDDNNQKYLQIDCSACTDEYDV